jgi:hypothetical protein
VTGDSFVAMMENTALRRVPLGTVFHLDDALSQLVLKNADVNRMSWIWRACGMIVLSNKTSFHHNRFMT